MKKNVKRIWVFCLALVMIFTAYTTAFAETIYYYFGYLYTYISNDMVSLYGVEELDSELKIPDVLNNRNVVDIRNSAFKDNTDITSIYFSPGCNLIRIGSFAFKGCTGLSGTLTLPPTLQTMDTAAFQECQSLEGVVFDAALEDIPEQAFYRCTTLNSVILGENTKTIGAYAFALCPSLGYVEIPSTVTEIAATAFQNDSITLGVYNNSTAHTYAQDNGIQFVVLDAPVPTPTEPVTEAPTEPVTEAPTEPETLAPSEPVTEQLGYILGDADGNGDIESIDVTQIQRYLALMEVLIPESTLMHGDVDGNGELTPVDVTYIQRFMNEMTTPYPIGEFLDQ